MRKIKDISLDASKTIEVIVGVYKCIVCNVHFRFEPEFVAKGKHYTSRAVNHIYTAIQEDKATFTGIPNRVKRDLNITPSKSTCHRWFHRKAGNIDLSRDYYPHVINSFSGVLAMDEVFDGGRCIFFATDPLNDRTIDFHRSDYRDAIELRTFLYKLKGMGIVPEVFLSDGAPVYENIPREVFGVELKHQLCTFHFIKDCMKDIMDSVRYFRRKLSRRPKIRDRKEHPVRYKRLLDESKDRDLIWKNRSIFTTRNENLSGEQKIMLNYLCSKYSVLNMISNVKDGLLDLFTRDGTKEIALAKRDEIIKIKSLLLDNDSPIIKVIKRLESKNFEKTLTFLEYQNLDSTTNQVERTNRWFRKRQKTHYRNRKEENIVNMIKADLIGRMDKNMNISVVKLKRKEPISTCVHIYRQI